MRKSSDYFAYSLDFALENSMVDLCLPGSFGLGRYVEGSMEVVVDEGGRRENE